MEADALEEEVVAIFEKLACKSKTIVKFSRRKDCQQVWDVMRDLQKIKMENYSSVKANAHIRR